MTYSDASPHVDGGVTLSKKQFAELISMGQKFPLKENLKVRKK
jgi:hypothetical protein